MNNLLLQLIAARSSGGRGSTGVAEMISRIRSANSAVPAQDPNQLLAQLGSNSTLVQALSKYFAESQTNNTTSLLSALAAQPMPVIDVDPTQQTPTTPNQLANSNDDSREADGKILELTEEVQGLQAEIKTLRERCDALASTVGACCLCWGQDSNCRACRGRGKPGYAIPDEALFGEYILPAVRVLRAQKFLPGRAAVTASQVQSHIEVNSKVSGSN